MKTLYAYYREEKWKEINASEKKPQSIQDKADFARISIINDEWNREVGKAREARLNQERQEMKEQIERNLQEQMEWEEEQKRITNEFIRKEKVRTMPPIFDIHLSVSKLVLLFDFSGGGKIVHCS